MSGSREIAVPIRPGQAPAAPGAILRRRSASADVPRGHPPEFECRGAGCHDRVLRGEVAQCLLVIGLDNREAVRVVVSENRSNTTMSPRSRYGRQWAAWRFMISRSASVIVWAKFGRGAMRRRTKVGMQRTLQPRIRQKVKHRDRRYRSARLERTGLKGPFQYRTAGVRALSRAAGLIGLDAQRKDGPVAESPGGHGKPPLDAAYIGRDQLCLGPVTQYQRRRPGPVVPA